VNPSVGGERHLTATCHGSYGPHDGDPTVTRPTHAIPRARDQPAQAPSATRRVARLVHGDLVLHRPRPRRQSAAASVSRIGRTYRRRPWTNQLMSRVQGGTPRSPPPSSFPGFAAGTATSPGVQVLGIRSRFAACSRHRSHRRCRARPLPAGQNAQRQPSSGAHLSPGCSPAHGRCSRTPSWFGTVSSMVSAPGWSRPPVVCLRVRPRASYERPYRSPLECRPSSRPGPSICGR